MMRKLVGRLDLGDNAVLAPMLRGVEILGHRVRPERTIAGEKLRLIPAWPDGLTIDAIGVASRDGPILLEHAVSPVVLGPNTVYLEVPDDGWPRIPFTVT